MGVSAYTQASSPIRRFGDLVGQRQIAAALNSSAPPYAAQELMEVSAAAESAEVENRQLEERANNYWLLRYLERKGSGAALTAVVIDRKGAVELEDLLLRGRLVDGFSAEPGAVVPVTVDRIDALKGDLRLRRV